MNKAGPQQQSGGETGRLAPQSQGAVVGRIGNTMVLVTANASKGVQAARAAPIDLLIMDVGLPDMDGREAVKLLRKGGFKSPAA